MKEINIFTYLEDLIKFAAFAISIIALMISLKNRRNGIREHIFKEQFNAVKDLIIKINEFTFIIECKGVDDFSDDDLLKLNDIKEKAKELFFSYQFLIVETKNINDMIYNQLQQMDRIIGIVQGKENYIKSLNKYGRELYIGIYEDYFEKENKLLNKVQKQFHIKKITKENRKIFQ
ncbi:MULTISPECIES: hypothetical protein [unclassified Empedobacter]|uniref:hypothetical protein n=1 Tax=unclassified Empedobacter TaxID=2643773 RepID=UPI0025C4F81C|nr:MULTISPECIES: hypothetical protein [unclassified Empedobacter]